MKNEIDVSVIIVNYNTLKMTLECIESVINKTHGVNYEIILVDNGSTDGSKEYFENDSRIKYIYSNENLGFGRANNLGYKYTSGKYILLLNSDTLLINNAIKILSDYLDNNENVAFCGGQLYNLEMKPIHSYSIFMPSIWWELDLIMFKLPSKVISQIKKFFKRKSAGYKVAYITGADMMLRKKQIEQFGFFDPDFFLYYEETELTARFNSLGAGISICVPEARIIHLEGKSTNHSEYKFRLLLSSRKLYFLKTATQKQRYLANIGFIVYRRLSILRHNLLGHKKRASIIRQELKIFQSI